VGGDRALQPKKAFCWKKRFLKSEVPFLDISNNKNEVALEKVERAQRSFNSNTKKIVHKNYSFGEFMWREK
jgi:hypothetical protein